jgi:hypothetical protein
MENRNLIGRKVKGFKFDDDKYKGLDYNRAMDSCIGEIGEIVSYYHPFDCYYVEFINKKWSYPASLIEQHLVEESPKLDQEFPKDDFGVIVQGNAKEIVGYLVSKGFSNKFHHKGVNRDNAHYCIEKGSNLIEYYSDNDLKPTSKTFTLSELKAMDKAIESETKYTCKDLSEGRVACKNDGTIDDLQTVLEYCFPDDSQIANGICSYYMRWSNNYAKWCGYEKGEIENIPTQSVKVFLKEIEAKEPQTMTITTSKEVELNPNDIVVKNEPETKESNPLENLPIIGDGVLMEVSDDEKMWLKRYVVAKHNEMFIAAYDNRYTVFNNWRFARPITPKTKITRAEFESKFEIID